MLPKSLKERLFYAGRLRKQLRFSKEILKEFPDSFVANLIYSQLRKKFFYGKSFVNYSSLSQKLSEIFSDNSSSEFLEIRGCYFFNEHAIQSEYVEIFLSDPFEDYSGFVEEKLVAARLLPIFVKDGPYQTNEVRIEQNDIVLDVGANMGVFSIFAVHKGAKKVYAFEPGNLAWKMLKDNIERNNYLDSIEICHLALNDKNEQVELIFNPKIGHVAASLFAAKTKETVTEIIPSIRIDDWVTQNKIKKIDFIKADIEGAERNMLLGAINVLKEFAPKLVICTYHLPDDPVVLGRIIKKANPKYNLYHTENKLFACV